ncbi:MAG: carbohydrate-binding protein [Myxococcota bacterium]
MSLFVGCDDAQPRDVAEYDREQESFSQRIEAEDRTDQQGWSQRSNHGGYTGSGFMDAGGEGTWLEWDDVNVPAAGEYELTVRYANGSSNHRRSALIINDDDVANEEFAKTGGWSQWNTRTRTVFLEEGDNTIRFEAITSRGGPNIDHIELHGSFDPDPGVEPEPEPDPDPTGIPTPGATGLLDRGAGTKIRIASWNNHRGSIFPKTDSTWRAINRSGKYDVERTEGAERIITAVDADIWLLQETSYGNLPSGVSTNAINNKIRGYMNDITGDSWTVRCNGRGLCMMMRGNIGLLDTCLGERRVNAYMVELRDHDDATLMLLNTHYMSSSHANKTRSIIEDSNASAVFVGGDFNNSRGGNRFNTIDGIPGMDFLQLTQWVDWDAPHLSTSMISSPQPQNPDAFPENTKGYLKYGSAGGGQALLNRTQGGDIDHFFLQSNSGSWEPTHHFTLNTLMLSKETLAQYDLEPLDVALLPKRYEPYFSDFMSTGQIEEIPSSVYADSNKGMDLDHLPMVVDLDFSAAQASSSGSLDCG